VRANRRHKSPVSEAIQGILPEAVSAQLGCKLSEIRRVVAAVHRRGKEDLAADMVQVSKLTRQRLAESFHVGSLEIGATQTSTLDPFMKLALRTTDDHWIETVRIPLEREGRYSVCVSSQVGCAMGCKFCKSTQTGLVRNLSAWEIVEQVRIVRQTLPEGARVSGVVFQGMGEPLANLDAVVQAVQILSHPACQCIDQKAMTICTSGLPHGIIRLREARLRVRIGLSIGSALANSRGVLMPLERRFSLCDAVEALIDYARSTRQTPMLAYTMLGGINCTSADAEALRKLALGIGQRCGRMPRLSLLAYNPIGLNDSFARASDEEAESFRLQLVSAGFPVVRRYSGGSDIGAACGQLAAGRHLSLAHQSR
jgi:23S rRNA (adenine2503-C2)-methyltransferase